MLQAKHARALLTLAALGVLIYAAFHAQPSRQIRIAAGPIGGSFYATALQYKALIESKGYRVDIVPFENTDEIEARVANDRTHFDLGFVADSGNAASRAKLVSLGDIQLQPIFIFENRRTAQTHPVQSFSDLRGLSLVLPPQRSLTSRTLLHVFALSGIDATNATIAFLPLSDGIASLKRGAFDAGLFILGADSELVANLAKDKNLVMVQIAQQDAIAAKLQYLSGVRLPEGVYDVSHDVPPHDVKLLAATISVVARRDLPPATTYVVLEAMRAVHRKRTYVNDADAFPHYSNELAQPEHLVDDFYRNGTPWTFSHLPIAVASVVDAYLDPLLAIWVFTGALNVLYEVERVRLLLHVALAHVTLWWIRLYHRNGKAPPRAVLAIARRLAAGLSHNERGAARLLGQLRHAIRD